MREIKFRIWCENKKEWEKNNCVISLSGSLFDMDNQRLMRRETHIIEQFTGLQDKSGVDIYEGDIVLLCGGYSYSIVFYNGSFVMNGIKDTWMQKPIDVNHLEVTGNIHE